MSEQLELDLGLPPVLKPVQYATAFLVLVSLDGTVAVRDDVTGDPIEVLTTATRTNIRGACTELLRHLDLEDNASVMAKHLNSGTTIHNTLGDSVGSRIRERLAQRGLLTESTG